MLLPFLMVNKDFPKQPAKHKILLVKSEKPKVPYARQITQIACPAWHTSLINQQTTSLDLSCQVHSAFSLRGMVKRVPAKGR